MDLITSKYYKEWVSDRVGYPVLYCSYNDISSNIRFEFGDKINNNNPSEQEIQSARAKSLLILVNHQNNNK